MKTFIFTLFLVPIAFAGTAFEYKIQFGSQLTQYKLSDGKKPELIKIASGNPDRKIEVSIDNKNFLLEQVNEIAKQKSDNPNVCGQRIMKIDFTKNGKTETRLGCIGAINPTSQKLTALANLLGYL